MSEAVTLAILAGGAGTRMGKPKGNLRIAEKPILAHLLDRLAWPGPTLLVTAPGREHPPGADRVDREVVDPVPGEGPLRGVLTALEHATTDTVVVVTIDMPCVTAGQLAWLLEQFAQRDGTLGLMTSRSDQTEPFPSVYARGASDVIARDLAERQRSVHRLVAHKRFVVLPAPGDWDDKVWTNLNRPADVQALNDRD
jgi:molybdenum cofactor guanylyltransferase